MQDVTAQVALLAPVPLVHLKDGALVCSRAGKVAFGSRAWKLFRQLDGLRDGSKVDVYLYASHIPAAPAEVSWFGRYVGHVESAGGAHPQGMEFRPPSTGETHSDNQGYWAVFWEVEALSPLPKPISTGELRGLGKAERYGRNFVPEGPIIIEYPSIEGS